MFGKDVPIDFNMGIIPGKLLGPGFYWNDCDEVIISIMIGIQYSKNRHTNCFEVSCAFVCFAN